MQMRIFHENHLKILSTTTCIIEKVLKSIQTLMNVNQVP